MTHYKVTYFNATWLGEPIRFILSHQGIKFDEVRHTEETFAKAKTAYPTQHVPTLEIDGKVYFQSVSICRYLANKFGLAGNDDEEKVTADIAVDTIVDLRTKLTALYLLTDAKERADKAANIVSVYGPLFLGYLNKLAKENGGYFVGGKLTWADLFFSAEVDVFLKYLGQDLFDNYPELVALNEKVRAIPNIKEWVENRPEGED